MNLLDLNGRNVTVVACSGKTALFTRMNYVKLGRYVSHVPVLRIAGDNRAHILWDLTSVALNPTMVCLNDTLVIIGTGQPDIVENAVTVSPPPSTRSAVTVFAHF